MTKQERFTKAYYYLLGMGLANTQDDVAAAMKATQPNVSKSLKGDEKTLTDRFLGRFNRAYGDMFNLDWLMTGRGEMLASNSQNVGNVDNANVIVTNGNGNNMDLSNAAALRELKDIVNRYQTSIEKFQSQVEKQNEHIEKLINYIIKKDS